MKNTNILNIDRQLNRQPFLHSAMGVNEKRFVMIDKKPEVVSQYNRFPEYNFENLQSRDKKSFSVKQTSPSFF
jgi:hypothetical protein